MAVALQDVVTRWIAWGGFDNSRAPAPDLLAAWSAEAGSPCREPAQSQSVTDWEERHGYRLPAGLRALLLLSNGLYRSGPLVHPITAIGPMIPFAAVPGMMIQPESWFELGNPNLQTVCIDLAYRLPGGGCPVFTSGDDGSLDPPRVIARSFEEWFLELIRQGGREYWFDPGFPDLGSPWPLHRRHVDRPRLDGRLAALTEPVERMAMAGASELEIATDLGLSRGEIESIVRHIQHAPADVCAPTANGSAKKSG